MGAFTNGLFVLHQSQLTFKIFSEIKFLFFFQALKIQIETKSTCYRLLLINISDIRLSTGRSQLTSCVPLLVTLFNYKMRVQFLSEVCINFSGYSFHLHEQNKTSKKVFKEMLEFLLNESVLNQTKLSKNCYNNECC